jgi:hypothetical protein
MPLVFPTSSTIGQTYQSGSSPTYTWDGITWVITQPTSFPTVVATGSFVTNVSSSLSASYSLTSSLSQTASFSLARRPTELTYNYSQSVASEGITLTGNAVYLGNEQGIRLTPNATGQYGTASKNVSGFNWNRDFRATTQIFVADNGTNTGDYMNIQMGATTVNISRTANNGGLSISFDDYLFFPTGRGMTIWNNNTLIANEPVTLLNAWYNIKVEVRTNAQNTRNVMVWYNDYFIGGVRTNFVALGNFFGMSAETGAATTAHYFRYLNLEYI